MLLFSSQSPDGPWSEEASDIVGISHCEMPFIGLVQHPLPHTIGVTNDGSITESDKPVALNLAVKRALGIDPTRNQVRTILTEIPKRPKAPY